MGCFFIVKYTKVFKVQVSERYLTRRDGYQVVVKDFGIAHIEMRLAVNLQSSLYNPFAGIQTEDIKRHGEKRTASGGCGPEAQNLLSRDNRRLAIRV